MTVSMRTALAASLRRSWAMCTSTARTELAGNAVLSRDQLAIDGNDLMVDLGVPSGRHLGRLLNYLTERVIAEPALNDRAILLDLARHEILKSTREAT